MSSFPIQPLADLLVFDITPADITTPGGIIIAEAFAGPATRMEGVIVAAGPTVDTVTFESGKRALVGKWASNELERNGRKYRLARAPDVLALLTA